VPANQPDSLYGRGLIWSSNGPASPRWRPYKARRCLRARARPWRQIRLSRSSCPSS